MSRGRDSGMEQGRIAEKEISKERAEGKRGSGTKSYERPGYGEGSSGGSNKKSSQKTSF